MNHIEQYGDVVNVEAVAFALALTPVAVAGFLSSSLPLLFCEQLLLLLLPFLWSKHLGLTWAKQIC